MLGGIKDQRDRNAILARIRKLEEEPDKQGKALVGEFMGLRSVRAAGQRYRIVYRINEGRVEVLIVGVGLRQKGSKRDVYRRLAKALKGPRKP